MAVTPPRTRVMSVSACLFAAIAAAGFAAALGACATGPTTADLNDDNPVLVPSPPPFGMEEFFAEAATVSPVRARLGRWLFYDTRLSADGTISCATCHRPGHAFSEPVPVSTGIGGRRGRRKAPSLLNLAARTTLVDTPERDRGDHFFWDGRVTDLDTQPLVPIADPAEMGLSERELVERVSSIQGYRPYFQEAFGSDAITPARVSVAIADYVRTLRSGNAPFDRWRYAAEGRSVTDEAKRGSDVFFFTGRCAMCHAGFNFSDGRFHNLGVGWDSSSSVFADEGRFLVTGVDRDRGAFKTPALRDVSKRAPYMHDGSLATLREVVEFYNRGGNPNPWRSGRLGRLGLTPREVDQVVAFLETLNGEGYDDRSPQVFPR
jgi:cytochrome c peroxidase